MGYLRENAEKMDIQAERRMRAEAHEKQAEAERKLAKAEERLAEKEEMALKAVIELGRQLGLDRDGGCKILKEKLQLSAEEAAMAVENYGTYVCPYPRHAKREPSVFA